MHVGMIGPIDTDGILHLLNDDSEKLPRGYGGAPLISTLITELLRRGHRVSAFTTSADLPLQKDASLTVLGQNFSITYCPMRPHAWRSNGRLPGRIIDFYQFERSVLQAEITRAAPDVLHAHWAYEFALATLATKMPHVITCHDSPYKIARMNSKRKLTISAYRWLRVLMARKVLREAKCVTAVSPYMRHAVQGITKANIVVVPNPVDELATSLGRIRSAPSVPRFVMVCNGWDELKNPQPAILAFNALRQSVPFAQLHVYGNDFEEGGVAERWCRARSIQAGITFHGSVRHEQLLRELAEFDVLIHPSLEESFGMVIAEAMAMGLPVVAGNDSGAVPWVVGNDGTLCNVQDSQAIMQALQNTLDPIYYTGLSTRGIASAQRRFSTPAIAEELYSLYQLAQMRGSHQQSLAYGKWS